MESEFINNSSIKPGSLQYRTYQIELAKLCVNDNILVVLPTGLGKTAIALLIVAEFQKTYPNKKCLILAPTRPLCAQHQKFFQNHLLLEESQIQMITGLDDVELRRVKWGSRIQCATPQITIIDIEKNNLKLDEISLIIFDEAHRAVGDYSYSNIGKIYSNVNPIGRIIGMTASPPDDEIRVKEVLLNLGLRRIEFRDESSKDVKPYIQKTKLEFVEVTLPLFLQNIQKILRNAISSRVESLAQAGIIKIKSADNLSIKKLLEIRVDVERKGDFKARADLISAIRLSHALNLLETQSLNSFLKFFDRLSERNKGVGLRRLLEDVNVKSAYEAVLGASIIGLKHPKMHELSNILKTLKEGEKAIVFTSYRDSVEDIYQCLISEKFKARYLIGKSGKGQNQKEQLKTLDDMKKGVFDVLIATQVGEEGLDIADCRLVIFFDNVPSAVRFIQRRGRTGRNAPGKAVILITKGTKDEVYYWSSIRKLKSAKQIASKIEKTKILENGPLDKFIEKVIVSPLIYVDTRESLLLVDELKKIGCRVEIKALPVGDFVASDEVIIERKTVNDFVKSVIDGRLFSQLLAIRASYRKPIIIIEGDRNKAVGLGTAALFGALASLVSDFQVSTFMSADMSETCQMIFHIARREQIEKNKDIRIRSGRKPTSMKETQKFIVSGLPGVNNILADRLLTEFKTVANTFNAEEKKLKDVEGIGDILAKRISDVLRAEYTLDD